MFYKILSFLIEMMCWIAIFISPCIGFALIGVFIWAQGEEYITAFYLCVILGAVIGIIWAEYVRQRHGCSNYLGQLLS